VRAIVDSDGNRISLACASGLWRTRRAGASLTEVMVVVTIASMLLSLTATLLGSAMRVDSQLREQREVQMALARLGTRLRADVHAAGSAELVAAENEGVPGNGCQLTTGDGDAIHYQRQADGIVREIRSGDAVKHRDLFRLHRQTVAQFALDEFAGRSRLTLEFRAASDSPEPATGQSLGAIEVMIGLHAPAVEEDKP
jgi:type II secretory pathway pseudopilin PulG